MYSNCAFEYKVISNYLLHIVLSKVHRHSKRPTVPDTAYVLETTESNTHRPLKCNFVINDLGDMLMSLSRALEFFEIYLADLVADAAAGTRILQGNAM